MYYYSFRSTQLVIVLFIMADCAFFGYASLDFTDCGGDPLKSIAITDCARSFCTLKAGSTYNVTVIPEFVNPQVDDSSIEVHLIQYGALFNQSASIMNKCDYGCPITNKLSYPVFNLNFTVSSNMVGLPATLRISCKYTSGTSTITGYCVEINVSIYK
ncbi:uncharacterized protein [Euwallacea fornicatus]|uniref:uncharacterized protein n=1 Tax=Euwallacea fornicatus TaxID=995702 RepID=UPI0033901913